MYEPLILTTIAATFVLAGLVKGVIGLGLPTVCLGLLTALLDLPTAMALLLVPSLVTNILQAINGDRGAEILRRLWAFLAWATLTVWVGAMALTRVDLSLLSGLLGALLVFYALISLAGVRLTIQPRHEAWAGPLIGASNGILTGMTGSFVVPGVMFLQAIGLPRDALVQAMGMLFTLSTIALAFALNGNNLLTSQLGLVSVVSLIPALVGMAIGQMIRRRLSEAYFRRIFFAALLVLGAYIITSAILTTRG